MAQTNLHKLRAGDTRITLNRETHLVEIALGWVHGTFEEVVTDGLPLLSSRERRELDATEFPRRRESFLLGRYSAKRALKNLLNQPDGSLISISSGIFDQPLVTHPWPQSLGVTITHTQGVALAAAFPNGHPLGIDVERKDAHRLNVLASQMTTKEQRWADISGLDELDGATVLWTAKEALSKALTTGLMSPWIIYATEQWRQIQEKIWEVRFSNFAQYRVVTWIEDPLVFSIALPRKSELPREAYGIVAHALRA